MKNPSQPDTQRDEYMPDAPNAHKDRKDAARSGRRESARHLIDAAR